MNTLTQQQKMNNISFAPMTAKQFHRNAKNKKFRSNEIVPFVRYYLGVEYQTEIITLCKKLQTQKGPRKETYMMFDRIMNYIKRVLNEHDMTEEVISYIFQYNRTYLNDTTAEDKYYKDL